MQIDRIRKAGYYSDVPDRATSGGPFSTGTGGCRQFRIPGVIILSDGSLFAVTDARWDLADADCGGIDTLVSRSEDGGKTWRATYAALFPDTLGTPDDVRDATTCIDPAVVEDENGRIHILVDMFPTGVAPWIGWDGIVPGTGRVSIDGVDRIVLTADYESVGIPPEEDRGGKIYGFYVGDFVEDGTVYAHVDAMTGKAAPVISREDGSVAYLVDAYFNIYLPDGTPLWQEQIRRADCPLGKGTVCQNLFYRDSVLHVCNTFFYWHLWSDDKGDTWQIEEIGHLIKGQDESRLLISPGRATRLDSGRLLFPIYSVPVGETAFRLGFLYTDDGGVTWRRSLPAPVDDRIPWHSESEIVELADGYLRVFFRNGINRICYVDATWDGNGYVWSAPVATEWRCHADCNLSALRYGSRIYVSVAEGVGEDHVHRSNGQIFVFEWDDAPDRALRFIQKIAVTAPDEAFSYSSLTVIGGTPDTPCLGVLYDTCGDGFVRWETAKGTF